jgi:hypothetical protein
MVDVLQRKKEVFYMSYDLKIEDCGSPPSIYLNVYNGLSCFYKMA